MNNCIFIKEWAAWGSWTSCSVTCDSGVQERNRTCIKVDPDDADCEGENTQQKDCTVDACPITGNTSANILKRLFGYCDRVIHMKKTLLTRPQLY